MKLHLTGKIVLLFVLFAALLVATVGFLSYRSGSDSLEKAAVSELQSVAIEKEAALDTWAIEREADLAQLQTDPILGTQTAALLGAPPLSPERRAAHAALLKTLELRMNGPGTDYLELSILDPQTGEVITSTSPQQEGENKVSQLYFDQGRLETYIEEPHIARGHPGKIIAAGIPLKSSDGQVVAVLSATFDFHAMEAIVRGSTGLYRTEDAYLVNRSGLLLTPQRFSDQPAILSQKARGNAVQRCITGESGVSTQPDGRGVPVITVYRWMEKQKLGLLIQVDQAEVLAPTRALALSILRISIAAVAAATGIAAALARSITRPLRKLQRSVNLFADGKPPVSPTRREGGDELSSLYAAFQDMATRVDLHTAELAESNSQLQAAKNAVEAANRSRSELLANLSHEIQAPLDAVIGMTDRLLETEMTQDQRAFAETIHTSSSAVRGVLSDISDFSLIAAGEIQLKVEQFSLRDVVQASLGLLRATSTAKGLWLNSSIEETIPELLRGDARRLGQVLINILGNAIKFTIHGGVSLSVSMIEETRESVILRFEVVDTGIGIHLEAQQWLTRRLKVKTPFTTEAYGGTGLGLAICQNLVRKMRGEIGLDSALGRGSSFWFTAIFLTESDRRVESREEKQISNSPHSSNNFTDSDGQSPPL